MVIAAFDDGLGENWYGVHAALPPVLGVLSWA
jgi:hypothetical protein